MSALTQQFGRSPIQASRAAGTPGLGYHPCWQTLDSEVCLSAYLRTLAWAGSEEIIPDELILEAATFASPIDLDLWEVSPDSTPTWWPGLANDDQGQVADETATIIRKVRDEVESWGANPTVVLAASGCLSQTNLVQHDLEIRAFFQRSVGPRRPSSQELFEYLGSVSATILREASYLRFEGAVTIESGFRQLADWWVVPCSGSAHPAAPIIWQRWRGMRQIQCPSDVLASSELRAVCREDSIAYENEEGLIARWSDWTRGLTAVATGNQLPSSGWVLVAPMAMVEKFSESTGTKLAWAWEVASHFREYAGEKFTEHRMHFDHGTTGVILP